MKRGGTGMGFSACASVVLCRHHSTNAQYSSVAYQKDKQAKHGAFKQNNTLSDIRDQCTEKRCHTAFF